MLSRDHETGNPLAGLSGAQRARIRWACHRATAGCWFPYLNGTSQGELVLRVAEGTPEDARKDGRIIRARYAPLSPANGFPVSWSQQVIHELSGLKFSGKIPWSYTPFRDSMRVFFLGSVSDSGCSRSFPYSSTVLNRILKTVPCPSLLDTRIEA